jgi:hypothetical protein
MKIRLAGVLLFGWILASAGLAEDKAPAPAKIRDFPIATLARLGREIYRHDQMAWVATDILTAKHAPQELQRDGACGWVVDTADEKAPFVRFCRERDGTVEAAYDIVFTEGKMPRLVEPKDRKMTAVQRAHLSARDTAWKALRDGKKPWCGGNPNFVVLPDPDGSGFLVYVLRAKPAKDKVPIGGHYRVTVADDGKTVEQVDQLFASCLTLGGDVPDGGKPEVLFMSHIVSATPLETHVFLSLQEKLPFAVVTDDKKVWYVDKGEITFYRMVDELNKPSS